LRHFYYIVMGLLTICLLLAGCARVEGSVHEAPAMSLETLKQPQAISTSPHVQKITFHSASLNKDMKLEIYVPKDYNDNEKYAVLYLIHGYDGNEDDWFSKVGAAQKAEELINAGTIKPLIIVSPEIDNSYGINSAANTSETCDECYVEGMYGDYIIRDLITYVDNHYSTVADREGRYIGGASMGGWVALYTAFLHPELFSKVGGHSPAIWLDDWSGSLKQWLYPTTEVKNQRDPLVLAKTQDISNLSVYLDCGDQDGYRFYRGAEMLNQVLLNKNVRSEYHHGPGEHNSQYRKKNVENYLLFYDGM
jgi:enterochelin esterase-like enzyme